MARPPMSMEAMLDEERLEVLALLENTQPKTSKASAVGRSPSPLTTPRSPVRSMLDIGDDLPSPGLTLGSPSYSTAKTAPRLAPVRSMLDVGPAQPPVRSMLDVGDSPPSSTAKKVFSSPSSPIESSSRSGVAHPRSMSDAASRPADFGPRSSGARFDPTSSYQFSDIITNNAGHALPKRVTQGGKRTSMAEVMRGNDVSSLVLPGDRGRHYAVGGTSIRLKDKSKSPHNRGLRSNSPANLLQGRQMSPAGRQLLGDALDIDINNAYRRLSDAALARSGGSLSELGRRKKSADDATGSGRLAKDYLSPDGDLLVEDSSEDNGSSSEDEGERGRKAARSFRNASQQSTSSTSPETTKTPRSLLAAAEEERKYHLPLNSSGFTNAADQVSKLPRNSRSTTTDLCSTNLRSGLRTRLENVSSRVNQGFTQQPASIYHRTPVPTPQWIRTRKRILPISGGHRSSLSPCRRSWTRVSAPSRS